MTSHFPVSPAAPVLRSTPDMEIVQVILYVGSVIKVDLGFDGHHIFSASKNLTCNSVTGGTRITIFASTLTSSSITCCSSRTR